MLSRRQLLGALGILGAGAGAGALAWVRGTTAAPPGSGSCAAVEGARIRWIVPHAAGGGYDAESRLIEPFLERRLHAEIVIENLPGAGGITGAQTIASAPPNGRTLGFIGVPGLLVASMTDITEAPDPTAFTVLGRVSRSWHVWAARSDSPIRTLDDAIDASRTHGLVFALGEVGSVNFVSIGITADLIGAPVTLVPGFAGSQAAVLATIRGDVDLVCFDFEAVRGFIDAGELRPLLQVSDHAIDPHPSLAGVPLLGGADGWVARHAGDQAMALALIELVAAGRIVVAPPGLDPALADCLDRTLAETLGSADLAAAAARPLDIASGARARADVQMASRDLPRLAPSVQRLLRTLRG